MARASRICIEGVLIGRHLQKQHLVGRIVHIRKQRTPDGPAENAFVYVEDNHSDGPRARYISWINLYDIENAERRQPNSWIICKPTNFKEQRVRWHPYGWKGARLPSIADEISPT